MLWQYVEDTAIFKKRQSKTNLLRSLLYHQQFNGWLLKLKVKFSSVSPNLNGEYRQKNYIVRVSDQSVEVKTCRKIHDGQTLKFIFHDL